MNGAPHTSVRKRSSGGKASARRGGQKATRFRHNHGTRPRQPLRHNAISGRGGFNMQRGGSR